VEGTPALRCYGLVNVLWVGVARAWAAVPPPRRPALAGAGLAAADVAARVGAHLRGDTVMVCERLAAGDVKLLQFWLLQGGRLAGEHPASAAAFHAEAWRWELGARGRVAGVAAGADPRARAVAQAVDAASLWVRAARLRAQCLKAMDAAARREAVAEMLGAVGGRGGEGAAAGSEGSAALLAALGLLRQAGSLSAAARAACLPLLPAALAALESADLEAAAAVCRQAADALLAFALACCGAPDQQHEHQQEQQQEQEQEQQRAAASWEECQLRLLEASVRPHPLVEAVLTRVWAALAAAADPAAAKQLIVAMQGLQSAAAATAAAHGGPRPSAALGQLTRLLAALLAGAPDGLPAGYFGRHLVPSPVDADDCCHLACLSAAVRTAALVDSALGGDARLALVTQLAQQLLGELRSPSGGGGGGAACGAAGRRGRDAVHTAWALECVGGCVDYVAAAPGPRAAQELAPLCGAAAAAAADALASAHPASPEPPPCAAPALAVLAAAWRASPGCLSAAQLQALLPALGACASRPALLARVAGVAAAYKAVASPPGALFASLLGAAHPAARHAAVRAYVDYLRGCERHNMLGVLPPAAVDPATGAMAGPFKATVEQYLRGLPADDFQGPSAAELAEWGPAVRAACARQAAAVQEARAALEARPAEAADVDARGGRDDGAAQAVVQAAADVGAAVARLEQAWRAAGGGGGRGGQAAAAMVRESAGRLQQLGA
jgi:hypothetical protein